MKRIVSLVMLLAAVLLCGAAAAEYSPNYLMNPPQEVLSHIKRSFPTYTLEDYCEVEDTPNGDYGFALLTAGDERVLLGYEEKAGKMAYWLKNHGAVPQGSEKAGFFVSQKGEQAMTAEGEFYTDDGWTFGVLSTLEVQGESYEKWVRYHWEDSGFVLTGYKNGALSAPQAEVKEGSLYFSDEVYSVSAKVYGSIQRDIRYVSYQTLPATIEEARKEISTAPNLPYGVLQPTQIKFTGGQKHAVYTGPGEQYARSGNGKGEVSTNDWIQVFGRLGDWIMIQYDISSDRFRIGWIEASALPKGAQVQEFDQAFAYYALDGAAAERNQVLFACSMTDDPFNSRTELAYLPEGTLVTEIIEYEGWSYIRTQIDGREVFGFVPKDCISHG